MMMQSYEQLLDNFKEILRQNSLKFTNQREIVLKTLYEEDEHYTPEDLYLIIKEKYPKINVGIATVYRTLNLLEHSDIITSITFGANGKKYELSTQMHHDHMICDYCNKIIEFHDDEIEQKQLQIAKKHGFKLKHHIMQLHGICQKCQEKYD
jgi:Fur family ferric uptake transcriptional regulator